jgi:hypothetical protein
MPGLFDSFHLAAGTENSGYSLYGWPPEDSTGWLGTFEAVYYFDGTNPTQAGLFFASFDNVYGWALSPPSGGGPISAFYYEKVDADTYYLSNLARSTVDPNFPTYGYGQPMYADIDAALEDLIDEGTLADMLIIDVTYDKQP